MMKWKIILAKLTANRHHAIASYLSLRSAIFVSGMSCGKISPIVDTATAEAVKTPRQSSCN